jgi:RNA polymerase sigma-70 factor (ECF subfamily)
LPGFSLTAWMQRGLDLPDNGPSPEVQTAVTEIHSDLWTAVQGLKPRFREAIILRYWAGYTYREMAEILDCPVPTIQSRVRLAYDKLKLDLVEPDTDYLTDDGIEILR